MANPNLKVVTNQRPKLLYLTRDRLNLSAQCQRTLDKARVKRYAEEFWEAAIIPIVVNEREDGEYYIIDGQHRAILAAMACGDDYPIPCWVLYRLSLAEEAKLFRFINRNRKGISGKALMRTELLEGERNAVRLRQLVKAGGFDLHVTDERRPWNHFANSSTLQRILKDVGEDAFKDALKFMHKTWFEDKNCCDTEILKGVLVFLKKYGPWTEQKWSRVSKRLSQFSCQFIRGKARTMSHTHGALTGADIARTMQQEHDYKLQVGRLEERDE